MEKDSFKDAVRAACKSIEDHDAAAKALTAAADKDRAHRINVVLDLIKMEEKDGRRRKKHDQLTALQPTKELGIALRKIWDSKYSKWSWLGKETPPCLRKQSMEVILKRLRKDRWSFPLNVEAGIRYAREGRNNMAIRYLSRGLSEKASEESDEELVLNPKAKQKLLSLGLHVLAQVLLQEGISQGHCIMERHSHFSTAATVLHRWLKVCRWRVEALKEVDETLALLTRVVGPLNEKQQEIARKGDYMGEIFTLHENVLKRLVGGCNPLETDAKRRALGDLYARFFQYDKSRQVLYQVKPRDNLVTKPATRVSSEEHVFDIDDDILQHREKKEARRGLDKRLAMIASVEDKTRVRQEWVATRLMIDTKRKVELQEKRLIYIPGTVQPLLTKDQEQMLREEVIGRLSSQKC